MRYNPDGSITTVVKANKEHVCDGFDCGHRVIPKGESYTSTRRQITQNRWQASKICSTCRAIDEKLRNTKKNKALNERERKIKSLENIRAYHLRAAEKLTNSIERLKLEPLPTTVKPPKDWNVVASINAILADHPQGLKGPELTAQINSRHYTKGKKYYKYFTGMLRMGTLEKVNNRYRLVIRV